MFTNFLAALLAIAGQPAAAPQASPPAPPPIAVGQVWEYHSRPQDAGSLLKVQRTEKMAGHDIFHITVIRVQMGGMPTAIQHLPMARESLQRSVVRTAPDPGTFPSPDEGIAAWREAEGGAFTVTVAEAIDLVEGTAAAPN